MKKFNVKVLVPMEFEVKCETESDAKGLIMTLLAEQREDSDYAALVADCIEEALEKDTIEITISNAEKTED